MMFKNEIQKCHKASGKSKLKPLSEWKTSITLIGENDN